MCGYENMYMYESSDYSLVASLVASVYKNQFVTAGSSTTVIPINMATQKKVFSIEIFIMLIWSQLLFHFILTRKRFSEIPIAQY